jgi:cob(I)alamin adenosyltransferase
MLVRGTFVAETNADLQVEETSAIETSSKLVKKQLKELASCVFEIGGFLAQRLECYEARSQQIEMIEGVADAYEQGVHVLVEAATGTGKTFAYLAMCRPEHEGQNPRPLHENGTANSCRHTAQRSRLNP